MRKKLMYLIVSLLITSCAGSGYNIDGDKVTYTKTSGPPFSREKTIKDADATTFKILEHDTYAVDKNRAYFKEFPIAYSDPKTFVALHKFYAKDKSYAYRHQNQIHEADGKTFEVLIGYTKDYKDYYSGVNRLYVTNLKSFKDLTVKRKNRGLLSFAKDETHYYIDEKKYPHADYASFTVLNNNFYKDKQLVYAREDTIKGADTNTFQVILYKKHLELSKYAKDKNNVYFFNKIVEGADIASFKVHESGQSATDKNGKYFKGKKVN